MKYCPKCRTEKPNQDFYKARGRADGLSSRCKACTYSPSQKKRQRQALEAAGIRNCSTCKEPKLIDEDFYVGEHRCKTCCVKRSSEYNREVKHDWSPEEYSKAYTDQDGRCAVCNTWFEKLLGDHCHVRQAKRKLLCTNCNFLLGHAKDSIAILLSAASYLAEFSEESADV